MKRFIILLALIATNLFGETATIERTRTSLREGPGSYYPALLELEKGQSVTVLTPSDSWTEVQVGKTKGFISAQSFIEKKAVVNDPFMAMANKKRPTAVPQSGVSAAVKGFAEKFNSRLEASPDALSLILKYRIDPKKFEAFRFDTYGKKGNKAFVKKVDLPKDKFPSKGEFSFSEEGVGLAIASKLSELGLYNNKALQDYVNYVGLQIAEAGNAYDIPFKFFILNTSDVNAFSCPGGIVFVSKGAIDLMENEAELAFFLAHEVAHVSRRHGMKEMEKRKDMIHADNAFDQLNKVTDTKDKELKLINDLDDIALSSYDNINHGRLEKYEAESDAYALLFGARAGYDPTAMIDFLNRMTRNNAFSNNKHYTAEANKERVERWEKAIKAEKWHKKLFKNEQRFTKYTY